eukprot:jgi/Mesvir1/27119/Mv20796-RA.1
MPAPIGWASQVKIGYDIRLMALGINRELLTTLQVAINKDIHALAGGRLPETSERHMTHDKCSAFLVAAMPHMQKHPMGPRYMTLVEIINDKITEEMYKWQDKGIAVTYEDVRFTKTHIQGGRLLFHTTSELATSHAMRPRPPLVVEPPSGAPAEPANGDHGQGGQQGGQSQGGQKQGGQTLEGKAGTVEQLASMPS